MASKPTYEEVLRYVVEATGDKDIAAIARQILNLSDASDEAKESTARLLEGFADAQGLERSAKAFRALGTEITEVQGRYTATQSRITELTTEMAKVEQPTRRQEQELRKLTRQLSETGSELLSLRTKWQDQRETLEAAGVSTQRYGTIAGQVEDIQRRLAQGIQDHAQALLKAQQAQERAAEFAARLNKELDEQGRTTLDAAGDLKQYERAADAAGKQTRQLAHEAEASTSIFDKLRAAAGAVFAFFTVDKLVDGLKSVVAEGSKGEQELAQRSLLADLTTLTGRTGVYGAVPATFAQHPLALLKGFDELEMMAAVNKNADMLYNHMHNSFLQTLMLTGVPGLMAALWLTWRIASASVRVLFVRDGGISPAQKLLVLLPAALFVQGMLEHYLFVDSYSILNFLFFLFSGYVVRLGRQVSWKQAFPMLARRKKA